MNFPVFLVAGAEFDPMRRNRSVQVSASARRTTATTTNVIATNAVGTNDMDGTNGGAGVARQMLSTPLTGWFGCAGERGTGIAVLLDLVRRLSDTLPMLVVATGGHELGYFGAYEWMANRDRQDQQSVDRISSIVHVGASVAVDEPTPSNRQLISTRIARTSLGEDQSAELQQVLGTIGLALKSSTQRWLGEAEVWERLQVPMLSFSGAGNEFHTPNDVSKLVTSPASMHRVADALASAATLLDRASQESAKNVEDQSV